MPNYIYFISHGSRIKIGVSENVKRRMKDIGLHLETKPELLGVIKGTYAFEKHIHELLSAHRMSGEWFGDCPDVRRVMDRVLAGEKLGFKSPHAKENIVLPVQKLRTHAEWIVLMNHVAGIIFPDNTIGKWADAMGLSTTEVEDYFAGRTPWPRVVELAFGQVFFQECVKDMEEGKKKRKAQKEAKAA